MIKPTSRWFFAGAKTVVLSILILCLGCSTPLQHGLSEREANEILVLLESYDIKCKKVMEAGDREKTWMLSVPKSRAAEAWKILRENDLPRPIEKGFADVFSKSGLIPTTTEEKAMMLQALSGELSRTLESIDGVIDARVHLVLPDVNEYVGQEGELPQPSAAVMIKYVEPVPGEKLPIEEKDIAALVAHSVEKLTPERVSVVLTKALVKQQTAPRVISFLGIKMTEDSRGRFQMIFIGLVAFMLASWIISIFLSIKLATAKKKIGT